MITKIQKHLFKWYIMSPICTLFFIVSCQSLTENAPAHNYSGEEIFKGLYFFQGELPQNLETLKGSYEKANAENKANPKMGAFRKDLSEEIIKSIKELDPDFFDQFKKQIQSDNFYSIQLALGNGAKMLQAGGYKSKYSGLFKLSDDLQSKNVDLSQKEFKELDVTKKEDALKFKSLMKEKYDIDLESNDYKVACVDLAVVVAVAVVAVAAWAVAANIYYAVNISSVWNVTEHWGGASTNGTIGSDQLVQELAAVL